MAVLENRLGREAVQPAASRRKSRVWDVKASQANERRDAGRLDARSSSPQNTFFWINLAQRRVSLS